MGGKTKTAVASSSLTKRSIVQLAKGATRNLKPNTVNATKKSYTHQP